MTTRGKLLKPILEKTVGPFTFAMYMRVMRRDLELTQVEMAKKLGLSAGTLCDIEKGRQTVSLGLAAKLAKKIGKSIDLAVQTAIQDQLRKAKLPYTVELKAE